MGDFEAETRVTPLGGRSGHYRADLHEDWNIWGPNGGYVAAIALRAAGREAKIPRPAAFACHFLSVARFAPVELEVEVVRAGRRAESIRVAMRQQGRPVVEGLLRTAAEVPGLEHDVAAFPEVPDPGGLERVEDLMADRTERHNFWRNLESRPVWPERVTQERRVRDPIWREWYRFRPRATFDDVWVDAGRMLLLIDTMSWPAAAGPHPDEEYLAPNLEVAAWFHRSDPAGEWLLADHASPVAEGGLMATHGRVWSRDGRLLASGGAQLLCVPAPAGG